MNRELSCVQLPANDSAPLDASTKEHILNCMDAAESIGAILETLQISARIKDRATEVLQ